MDDFDAYRNDLTQDEVREAWIKFAAASVAGRSTKTEVEEDIVDVAETVADHLTRSMIARFGPKDK